MSEANNHGENSNRPAAAPALAGTRTTAAARLHMNEGELEYGAAAHPHQMCVDEQLSAGAYRVYGIMDWLKRNRIPPEPETIAELLGVTHRSVRRWITELHDAHWIVWNKGAADPWRRYELRQSNSQEEITLAQIRALFAAGQPSIHDIRRVLGQSDTDVQTDTSVQTDTDVQTDTSVQIGDTTITDSDPGVQIGDTTISGLDSPVHRDSQTPHSTAAKRISAAHVVVGSITSKKRSPTAATAHAQTVTEIWLRAEGVSKKKAKLYSGFDIHAVQHEWNETIPARGQVAEPERQKRIGGLLDRWEVRPPALPPAAPAAQAYVAEEAAEYAQARALLPNGTPLELHYLYLLLEAGTAPQEALARVQSADHHSITLALAQLTRGAA